MTPSEPAGLIYLTRVRCRTEIMCLRITVTDQPLNLDRVSQRLITAAKRMPSPAPRVSSETRRAVNAPRSRSAFLGQFYPVILVLSPALAFRPLCTDTERED